MFKVMTTNETRNVIGGNNYIYKCTRGNGSEYWATQPSDKGCLNSQTGRMEYDTKKKDSK